MSTGKRRTPNAGYVRKDPTRWRDRGWTPVPNALIRDPELSPEECWAWAWLASHSEEFEVSGRILWESNKSLGRNRAYELLSSLERRGLLLRRHVYDDQQGVPYVQYDLQPVAVPEEERTWVPPRAKARERAPHPGSKAALTSVAAEAPAGPGVPDRAGIPSELDFPDRAGERVDSRQGGSRQGGKVYKEEKTMEKNNNQPGPGTAAGGEPVPASSGWLDGQPLQPHGQVAVPPSVGVRFLESLPAPCRPDGHAIQRLAPKVEQLLAGEWSEPQLLRRLTGNIDGVFNAPGVVVRRLMDLPLPKGVPKPERPAWCGECDEHTRQRENDAGLPYRCPQCHPLAVGA